jgi:hypothetical protein
MWQNFKKPYDANLAVFAMSNKSVTFRATEEDPRCSQGYSSPDSQIKTLCPLIACELSVTIKEIRRKPNIIIKSKIKYQPRGPKNVSLHIVY